MKPLDSRRSVAAALLLCLPLACAPSLAATASVMSYVDMQRDLSQLIPALRSLPLLQKLARGEAGIICLDYLPPMQLNVDLQPC